MGLLSDPKMILARPISTLPRNTWTSAVSKSMKIRSGPAAGSESCQACSPGLSDRGRSRTERTSRTQDGAVAERVRSLAAADPGTRTKVNAKSAAAATCQRTALPRSTCSATVLILHLPAASGIAPYKPQSNLKLPRSIQHLDLQADIERPTGLMLR